jgi:tetratricopeptide (TPR) repeat protein
VLVRLTASCILLALTAAGPAAADPCHEGARALERRDLDGAEKLLRQCLDQDPPEAAPYLMLCGVYQLRQDSDALYRTASKGLKRFPDEPRFYLTVGTHDARAGRYDDAIKIFEEGLRRWPEDRQVVSLLASSHYARGAELLDGGENEAAAKHLSRATKLTPDYVEAHLDLGRALHNLLRSADALAAFNRVIELDPQTPLAQFHRGLTYYSMGEFDRAIEDLDEEIAGNPGYPPAYLVRGLARLESAEWATALADLEIAVARMPGNSQAWHGRARALVQSDRLNEAEKALRKAMELDPEDPAPVNTLVSVLTRLDRSAEARPLRQKAAELARARRSAGPGEIRFESQGRAAQ